jgi:7-cyano-7-deazaguanine synthase
MRRSTPTRKLTFHAICARQRSGDDVFCFAANAHEILEMARIDRVGRDEKGRLSGFQRPQIASHIREIQDYLSRPDAVLPNAVVLAFLDGVEVRGGDGVVELAVDCSAGPPGFVVDGQQRLTALAGVNDPDFRVLVSAIICRDAEQLRQQFILVNSARPLSKSLIYELLPDVQGLPERMSSRALAATITQHLNYGPKSSLKGQIYQHSNPHGIIRDTAIQKVVMNSERDGLLREIGNGQKVGRATRVISDFYGAVQETFPQAWKGQTPKTSRLVHSTGIVALGYVMDGLHALGASSQADFREGLHPLVRHTAWTSGSWKFGAQAERVAARDQASAVPGCALYALLPLLGTTQGTFPREEQMNSRTTGALVLFSGGQDSTTCLAWALANYKHVETIGFDYGQRHRIELGCRERLVCEMRKEFSEWAERLGEDHLVAMPFINEISETALTRDMAIEMGRQGLPNTFVPGRNVFFLTAAAAVAYRRGLTTLVGGMCETDYSGYPDCRDTTLKALQVALQLAMDRNVVLETPLMWLDKAATWKLAHDLGGQLLVDLIVEHSHTCYMGSRDERHDWGYGCAACPACELRLKGFSQYRQDLVAA